MASILNVKNSIIYLLVPKLPGNDCIVTVKVGNQEARFTRNFQYIENYSVTTIAGQPGTNLFVEGTLAAAQFGPVNTYIEVKIISLLQDEMVVMVKELVLY